jgi:hypothetical protein
MFDSEMSMQNQVNAIVRSVNCHLRNISRIRKFLDKESSHHVARSLVLSRLDYGNALLYGSRENDLDRLQRLQNRAAKIVCGASRLDSSLPFLKKLHWLPVRQRIDFKLNMYTYKTVNDNAPEYLVDCISKYKPGRSDLRSNSDTTKLVVPKSLRKTSDACFSVAGPRLWNDLPLHVKMSPSLPTFKKHLKTYLFPN